jgi:protein-disulfide isomerase
VTKPSERPEKNPARASGMGRFYVVLALIAVVGVGAVGYNVTLGRTDRAASVPLELAALDDDALVALARGATKGDSAAPVTILEFGDYQCPGCGEFARNYEPGLDLALIETGRASFRFHDYPLVSVHPHAFVAARAARCAEDQGMFWEYHDELFRQQARWSPEADPLGTFERYAEALELDVSEFRSCLHSDRHADVVTANLRLAESIGIPRTPTILVHVPGGGTREASGWDVASIEETIDLLTAARPTN